MFSNLLAYIFPLSIAWTVVFIVVLITLFKRDDIPVNTKLLWTFLILIFPLIGLTLYFVQYKLKVSKLLIGFSILSLVISLAMGCAVEYYVFVKPTLPRDLTNEPAITITAKDVVKEFQANEASATTKYNNKILEITGEVLEAKKDQSGKPTITLKSDDSFSNVFVTLSGEKQIEVKNGTTVTVKGVFTGFLSDVVLNEGVVTKQ